MDTATHLPAGFRGAKRWFWNVLRPVLGAFLRWHYRVRIIDPYNIRRMRPPYLIVGNHVNFWDPFLLGMAFGRPIHYLAADGNFRKRLMRFLLSLVGAIPKIKARTDLESIRIMQALVRSQQIVGFFPEGQRNWDGVSLPMMGGTGKLASLLRTPVAACVFHGGYLSLPRWTTHIRRGVLEIELRPLVTLQEVGEVSGREIQRRVEQTLNQDDLKWQRERNVRFYSKKRGQYLEMVGFECPRCGALGSMVSWGATATCKHCSARVTYGSDGALRWQGWPGGPVTVHDWNQAQLDNLDRRILAHPDPSQPLAWAEHLKVFRGRRSDPLYYVGPADVQVHSDGVRFAWHPTRVGLPWFRAKGAPDQVSRPPFIPIDRIVGIHVQLKQDLEFYVDSRLYLLRPTSVRTSSYWLEQTLKSLKRFGPH